jgi:hypothetical protein
VDTTHDGIPFGTRPGQHRGLAAQGYQSERAGINGGVQLKLTPAAELTDYCISFAGELPLWHVETRGGKALLEWSIAYQGNIFDSGSLEIDSEAEFTSDPIEKAYFGCAGVAKIDNIEDKLMVLAKGGFRHHTTVGMGHMKYVLVEAFKTYLGYEVIDIEG